MKPSENTTRKFEEVMETSSWEVLSHDGWRDVNSSNKTVPYELHRVELENGLTLECADTHILITEDFQEVYAKDSVGVIINTIDGPSRVVKVEATGVRENMYDLSVSGDNLYYCDGVLSHNTTVMGLYALHMAVFEDDKTVGITSYKSVNCKDFMDRIKYSYESLEDFLKPPCTVYNKGEVKFTNGSSIFVQVTSEQTFRGRTITGMAIIDEFAFVKPQVAEEFYTGFMPSLEAAGEESSAKVVIISTPNSSTGKYAELSFGAMEGMNGFKYHQVDHSKIPGRTEEWREMMIRKLGINKYRQEFEGAWLSDNSSLINSQVIESIKPLDPIRQYGDMEIYVDSFQGRTIAFACDVSEGVGKDNHAIQFIDVHTFEQVAEFANNTINQTNYFKTILRIMHLLFNEGAREVYYTVENNGLGNGILRLIENSDDPILNQAVMINDVNDHGIPTGKMGLYTTNKKKLEGCTQLKDLVEEGKLTLRSAKLLNELRMFTKHGATFKAEAGAKDDRVMAMVLLMLVMKQLSNYEDFVYDTLNEVSLGDALDDSDWGIIF